MEGFGDPHRFLARHGICDKENFLRLQFLLQAQQFVHQGVVDVQTSGRIEDHEIAGLVACRLAATLGDAQHVFHTGFGMDRHANLLAQHDQLVDRRRAVNVAGHQHGAAIALFLEVEGELGSRGGLSRTLQANHHRQGGIARKGLLPRLLTNQGVDQGVVKDLDHVFTRSDGERHFLTQGTFLDAGHEGFGHVELDVGLQKGSADIAQRIGDVLFGKTRFAAQFFHGLFEASTQVLEHGQGKLTPQNPFGVNRRSVMGITSKFFDGFLGHLKAKMSLLMNIEFWGVRGSIPVPGPKTVRFGGNTSCVRARLSGGDLVFDAGTGIRELGKNMVASGCSGRIELFLSHVHWDHIQGFPFFAPAMKRGVKIQIHGLNSQERTLESVVEGQMEGPTFPIGLKQMGADIDFQALEEGVILPLESAAGSPWGSVSCARLNHPNGVYAYRTVEAQTGASFVYATDTEHVEGQVDEVLVRLAHRADVLIYDGMFTTEEYPARRGWGHSTWNEGFKVAQAAGVKKLVVFHHDPNREDDSLDLLQRQAKEEAKLLDPSIEVVFAHEGMVIGLGGNS